MFASFRCSALLVLLLPVAAIGQSDDLAYVPSEAPARTADDVTIGFKDSPEPGSVTLELPAATYRVDLLNASGNVVSELHPENGFQLDLRTLRSGTWTVRAHAPTGLHVRRFVVLGKSGALWVNQPQRARR
jgi:hypothetical protein